MAEDRKKVKPMHDLIAEVGKAVGMPRAKVQEALKAFRDAQIRALADGFIVRVYDVGNLRLVHKPARKARNPRTGEVFDAPAGLRAKFEAGNGVRALIAHMVDGKQPYPQALFGAVEPAKPGKSKAKDKPADAKPKAKDQPAAPPATADEDKELADLLNEGEGES